MGRRPVTLRPPALVLALSLLGAALNAQAPSHSGQSSVRGSVVSAEELPIPQVLVELRMRRDSAAIRTVQTSEAGRFLFEGIGEGVYYLLIRRIGFGPVTTPDFTVAAAQARDVGRIRLQAAAVQLEPIEVTVERPDITFEPTLTGYLVEALTTAAGGVVTDALRELPDVIVDPDGTIRLRGNSPAIFINGRPAPMQGQSLAVFLEQFPADRIERIEVLESPPARYSAEGAAGIINIVLKQGVELGLTGNLSFSAGTRGQYSGSGRATLQKGKLTFNGGMDGRWGDSRSDDFTLRQNLLADPVTFLRQDARSDRSNRNGGLNLDLRYEVSKKTQVWGRFFGNLNGNDRDGITETAHLDELQDPTLLYNRVATVDGSGGSGEMRFGYEHSWVPDRHGLSIEGWIQRNRGSNDTREEIVTDPRYLGHELLPAWLTLRGDGSRNTGYGFEANYQRPLGAQWRLEGGSSFRRNSVREDQNVSIFDDADATEPDSVDARLISRIQHVGSAYVSLQRRFGKFGLVAGLRGELVAEDIRFPLGERVERDDATLFPNVGVNWSPKQRMGVRLNYARRVNRPGVSILDPTNRSTDPLNRSVGNPDVENATTHNINLSFNWAGRLGQLNLGPYWNRTDNGWERVTTVDTEGVSTSTYQNLTSRTNVGGNINFAPPRVWGWTVRFNLSASQSTLRGSLRSPGAADGKVRWAAGGNLSGPVIQGIVAQGNFGYEPGRDLVQGRTSGQWRADFNFRYRLMRNRTSIGVAFQDPFELRKTTQQIVDPSVIQTGRSRVTARAMTINVSYAFGGGGRGGAGAPADVKPVPVKQD